MHLIHDKIGLGAISTDRESLIRKNGMSTVKYAQDNPIDESSATKTADPQMYSVLESLAPDLIDIQLKAERLHSYFLVRSFDMPLLHSNDRLVCEMEKISESILCSFTDFWSSMQNHLVQDSESHARLNALANVLIGRWPK